MDKINHIKHNIYISGLGVILMGFWNVIKVAISLTVGAEKLSRQDVINEMTEDERVLFLIVTYVVLVLFDIFVIFFHTHIGLNAMRRAKGKKFRKSYFFWSVILVVIVSIGIPSYFTNLQNMENIDSVIAAVLVDLTMIFILGDIIISSTKLKKLEKKKEV